VASDPARQVVKRKGVFMNGKKKGGAKAPPFVVRCGY
jgi:hypothetical protein